MGVEQAGDAGCAGEGAMNYKMAFWLLFIFTIGAVARIYVERIFDYNIDYYLGCLTAMTYYETREDSK